MLTTFMIREAKIELGDAVAARLKLSPDGTKVLWPQPTDSPLDPQNWSDRRKAFQLLIITMASIVPDFDSGIGKEVDPNACGSESDFNTRNCVNICTGQAI